MSFVHRLVRSTWTPALMLLVSLALLPFLLKKGMGRSLPIVSEDIVHLSSDRDEEYRTVNDLRFELLASLDLLVRSERVLREEGGSYISSLGRVPDVLGAMTALYKIDIVKATSDRLIVTANGAPSSQVGDSGDIDELSRDTVSIDERFRVRMNFPLPVPPAGYLRTLAQGIVNRIQAQGAPHIPGRALLDSWEGVYRGHVRYEIRMSSTGARIVVAVPQSNLAIAALGRAELAPANALGKDINIFDWVSLYRQTQGGESLAKARLRQIYLAQKIIERETGVYADGLDGVSVVWNDLSSLAAPGSSLRIDEFQRDPHLGYQAEIALMGNGDQIRNLWSVNALGQITQTNPVEELMGRFEKARKILEPNRAVSSDGPSKFQLEPLEVDKVSDAPPVNQ